MTERKIFNPFNAAPKKVEAAPKAEDQEVATASALTNVDPSQCPKCPAKMSTAMIYDRRQVYYCDACRVTHPKE
jgi:transposase-like protein